MGKTRLAIEAAAVTESEFVDGTWWCDLASAVSAEALAPVVLDAIGARQTPGRTTMEAITDQLHGSTALVVLDNCEHVLDTARGLVQAIRRECPGVRVLCTSREALGIRGEHLVPVTSLPGGDAVTLFAARAVSARPSLSLESEWDAVREICTRLDGIPLALELAAARCRSMSPSEISSRLDQRFRLLRSGRSGSERHRTLQAAVAWSYELLDDVERDLFDRMAAFADGTQLDGLAAVGDIDEFDALDIVDRLVARSMVTAVDTPVGTRYRQLETLRQFAEDRLIERDELAATRDRHASWVCDTVSLMQSTAGTPGATDAFHRVVAEIDNVRSAVGHAVSSGQRDLAEAIVVAGGYVYQARPFYDVLDWLDPDDAPQPWTIAAVRVAAIFGHMRFNLGDVDAPGRVVAAVPAEHLDDPLVVSCKWFDLMWVRGDVDATEELVSAHDPPAAEDHIRKTLMRVYIGVVRMLTESLAPETISAAHRFAASHVAAARAAGDEHMISNALCGYANSLVNGGRPGEALPIAAEAVEVAERCGAGWNADTARIALGRAMARATETGAFDRGRAASEVQRFIVEAQQRHNRLTAAGMLDTVAVLCWETDPRSAYLFSLVYQRSWSLPSLLSADATEALGPDVMAEIQHLAEDVPLDEAISMALAVLDQYLAAVPSPQDTKSGGPRASCP